MQICSLLPSATEILFALGLGDSVLGVTHECDFPPEAAKMPPLIRPRVDPHQLPAVIDRQVTELVSRGESMYSVDAELLASLAPDLIVTQDLCHVCAASPDDLATAVTRFSKRPKILSLTPHSLADVWDDIRRIGEATGVMPCGYSARRAAAEFSFNELPSNWDDLAATRDRRVFTVDANSYFSRLGPRLSDGVEFLAHLFHPEIVALNVSRDAIQRL